MKLAIAAAFCSAFLVVQQRDATTTQKPPAGTGEIAGVVMTADRNPQPLRRVVVTINGGGANPRSMLTDDAGRFAFTKLPAGTFQVTARKAAYIPAAYGARRPGRAGTSIALVAGQHVGDLTISMFKGGVISGTLRSASGDPAGGIDIRAIDARRLAMGDAVPPVDLTTTDDRGVFRMYGVVPGDYIVVALPLAMVQGEITQPSATYIDAALSRLASRQSMGAVPSATSPASLSQPSVGFAPVFYPGTAISTEAVRVHVEAGEERSGTDFVVTSTPVASIEGTVTGVPSMNGVQVTLISSGARVSTVMSSTSLAGKPLDAQGNFKYSNLSPGRYRVVARAPRGGSSSMPASTPNVINATVVGGSGGGTPPAGATAAPSDYLYGVVDVDMRGQDVTGVSLSLQPGGVMTGRIMFIGTGTTPKPPDLTAMRIQLFLDGATGMVSSNGLAMGTGLITTPTPAIQPDGTFEIRGIGPGRFSLTSSAPANTKGWTLRSAKVGDRDLLDELPELGPGIDIRNVTITFSDTHTEVSGTLQTGAGQPAADYYIVALPADRAQWRPKSRRILSTRPASDGHFAFPDIPAGDYLIVALTDLDPVDLGDMTFLEQIAPAAITVRATEGQKTVQDLRIR